MTNKHINNNTLGVNKATYADKPCLNVLLMSIIYILISYDYMS